MTTPEAIRIEPTANALIARVHFPTLGDHEGDQLRKQIADSDTSAGAVIIDLSGVETISTDGLGDLVDILHDCQGHNRRLILAGIRPTVLQTLSVTRLGKLFEFRENVEQALQATEAAKGK